MKCPSALRCATAIRATLTTAVLLAAGCAQLFPPDSRQEAQHRWSSVRARLKLQLASERFEAGDLDQARRHLDEALALHPAYGEAFVLQARILLEKGETASASEALDEALRHGTDTPETDYLSGIISERYRDLENALHWYQRAAQRDATNASYVVAVAETLVALDRTPEALQLVRSRLTDFEQNAALRGLLSGIHMMLGEYEQAADAYRDAARIAPDDPRIRSQLGIALTLAQRYDEARPILIAASQGDAPETSILAALGRCHLALHEPEAAKAVLRRVVDAEPGNARYWLLLAQACTASNDLLTARRAAAQAAQLAPDVPAYRLVLGYICWKQQDYPAAIPVLEPLTRESRPDEIALYLLAQCYRAVGSADLARACVRRALQVNPDAAWASHWSDTPPDAKPVPAMTTRRRLPPS